jgi:hypothetical protein
MVHAHKSDEPAGYQIKVRAELDERWSDWFNGMTVQSEHGGDNPPITTLTGPADQSALRGMLAKIWDLGLTLISVVPIEAALTHQDEDNG